MVYALIPTLQEAEIGRNLVQEPPRQKVSDTPSSTNRLGIDRRVAV
jgi:hypothetical protein